jgi:trigger factor
MSIQSENTSPLGRKLTIEVPIEEINAQINKRINEYTKSARIDGFRKGKIPHRVIKERYGDAIFGEVINEAISTTIKEGLQENKLDPVTTPRIENLQASPNENLRYEAYFDVRPDIQLSNLSQIQIEKKIPSISEENIDETIGRLRQQQANWSLVERAAKEGDKLFLDVKVDVPNASIKDMHRLPCELGAKTMIPGFEDGLIGSKANDEVTLNLTFPDPYFDPDVAGKPATFHIQVLEVLESQLPTDEALAEKLGVTTGDELRAKVREHIEREANQALKNELKMQVWNKLLESHQFDLPESLIEKELHQIIHPNQSHEDMHHHHDATPEQKEQAENRVKTGLLMAELIKAYNVTPNPERMMAKITEMVSMFDNPSEMTQRYLENKNFLTQLQASVLEDQLIDEVLKVATVVERSINYNELFK